VERAEYAEEQIRFRSSERVLQCVLQCECCSDVEQAGCEEEKEKIAGDFFDSLSNIFT